MPRTPSTLLGAHTSIAGGLYHALEIATSIQATTTQLFTANQRQWHPRQPTPEDIERFHAVRATTGIQKIMSHASYLLNLGSPRPEGLQKSRTAFRKEIERCRALGVSFLNFHPGAALCYSIPNPQAKQRQYVIFEGIMSTLLEPLPIQSQTPLTLCWLRRDLRLYDHHALHQALKNHTNVLLLFIFDRDILDKLPHKQDTRVHFLHTQLQKLHTELKPLQTSLWVTHGHPATIFEKLIKQYKITSVHANEDYEPYALKRDQEISSLLATQDIPFYTYKDQVIFSPSEVLKKDDTPYTVYTPYMKQWKAQYRPAMANPFPIKPYTQNYLRLSPLPLPSLASLGFLPSTQAIPSADINTPLIDHYHAQRDKLDKQGTTQLGIHLRFGTISIREATSIAYQHNDTWLLQLIWRNFFMMILAHFPHVQTRAFKPVYDRIRWRNDPQEFKAWCEGQTGYPIVDAGMRELNATGFMHNRARMITASFLTKLLLIDWRWGEAYFAEKLLDYELASNNGNWQWAAGTGCDAAPYFRIFSPERQTERFDPSLQYIKKWVPEYQDPSYPSPIVDYTYARKRALDTYQKAIHNA